MTELVVAIVVVFVLVMGVRAFQGYKGYKGTLYQHLFSSYLEYFWRLTMKEDLSESSLLTERLGTHRIVYNAYRDSQGRLVASFATVFTTHGHAAICMLSTTGVVHGRDTGSWTVERAGKRFVMASPITYLKRQKKLLDSFMKGAPVEYIIAFTADADVKDVDCSYTVLTMDEVVEHLEKKPEGAVDENEVLQAFETFKGLAVQAG